MERWLVISNCNRRGLKRSLEQCCLYAETDEIHVSAYEKGLDDGTLPIDDYSRIFVNPQLRELASKRHLDRLHDVIYVPSIFFCGYHPDACQVMSGGVQINSPAGHLHSAICMIAFQKGLSASATESLFDGDLFERAGYFDVWEEDRAYEFEKFARHGIDLTDLFPAWSRAGPFMYTFNHPAVACIYDLVVKVLEAADLEHVRTPVRPIDDLRRMGTMPVYPAIGEQCGVPGTLYFERLGTNRLLPLREFIRRSYRMYEKAGAETLSIRQGDWERFQRLPALIG